MGKPPAPKTRIQRAGNGHSYFLDGEKCPGVTTIIGDGIPKNLQDWSAKMTAQFVVENLDVVQDSQGRERVVADKLVRAAREWNSTRSRPERISNQLLDRLALTSILKDVRYADVDAASNKGTEVHGLGERLARGEDVTVPEYLQGHVDSYVRFLDEWDPTEALLERVVVNRRWKYMGKVDLIAQFDRLPDELAERLGKDSARGLLDIKTSRSGIYGEAALQTEAYARAETMIVAVEGSDAIEAPMPEIDFIGAIWVRADGYDVFAFDRHPDLFRTFLYAKQVGEFVKWPDGPLNRVKGDALTRPAVTA